MAAHGLQQFLHVNPTSVSELQSHPVRFVPEDKAEELAGPRHFFVVHIKSTGFTSMPSAIAALVPDRTGYEWHACGGIDRVPPATGSRAVPTNMRCGRGQAHCCKSRQIGRQIVSQIVTRQ